MAADTVIGRPCIKWVGGKSSILNVLHQRLPKTPYERYFEPFVGGGALFWSLPLQDAQRAYLNDDNAELINFYEVIKTRPKALIQHVKRHKNTADYYYALRSLDRQTSYRRRSALVKASRFIYLNKTAFNGLWRVNASNQHNAPFGSYTNPKWVDEVRIFDCSERLQAATLSAGDYSAIRKQLTPESFVYFDPPYIPLDPTSNFTGYTKNGFGEEQQLKLRELCDHIDHIGAKFMLSNSSAKQVFSLYQSYQIDTIPVKRAINCKGDKRGDILETLIRNYD